MSFIGILVTLSHFRTCSLSNWSRKSFAVFWVMPENRNSPSLHTYLNAFAHYSPQTWTPAIGPLFSSASRDFSASQVWYSNQHGVTTILNSYLVQASLSAHGVWWFVCDGLKPYNSSSVVGWSQWFPCLRANLYAPNKPMNAICVATRLHPSRQPSSGPLTATSNPLPTTRLVRNYAVFSLPPA